MEVRLTRYRRVVLDVLRATETHPTAAEVFRVVRRRRPGVAYATIYNSLNWLERKGMIARVDFAEDAARFDPVVDRHDHLVCRHCGALRDIHLRLPPRLLSRARRQGFRIEHYRTELFGRCSRCARKNSR